jgi:hypothetical protein
MPRRIDVSLSPVTHGSPSDLTTVMEPSRGDGSHLSPRRPLLSPAQPCYQGVFRSRLAMGNVLRQVGKIWAIVLVVYALLANAVLPSFALDQPMVKGGVDLCLTSAVDDIGGRPLPGHDPDAIDCCILCLFGTLAAHPVAADAGLRITIPDVVPTGLKLLTTAVVPTFPEARPQSQRAPPVSA